MIKETTLYLIHVHGVYFVYRGTSLIRTPPPPLARTGIGAWAWSYCRILGGWLFLMSVVPIYSPISLPGAPLLLKAVLVRTGSRTGPLP